MRVVYINGQLIAKQPSGYCPLHVDITPYVKPGKAFLLAVHVDPSQFEGWWYEGGGIYRHVWLTSVDRMHITPAGVWVIPTVVGNESNPSAANVRAAVTLENSGSSAASYGLLETIRDANGNVVFTARRFKVTSPLAAGATATSTAELSFAHPSLWSIEHPNLYTYQVSLLVGGKIADQVATTFGVRTVRFDANNGFFLNGKPVKIKGVCNHQDLAGIGVAVPNNLQYWRVKKMQDFGANAWRMSHDPPNSALLDACDKLGMLVLDENRHLGDTYAPKTTNSISANNLSDLDSMIVRDRNHPCIIAWSLCNEEPLQGSEYGAELLEKMIQHVRKLDPSRLTTTAMNGSWGTGFSNVEDIQGLNYFAGDYAKFHQDFPAKPMMFTEDCSAVSDRGIYVNDWSKSQVGSYEQDVRSGWSNWLKTTEDYWKPIASNSYLSGCFVWTGFDYKGEPTPYGWPNISSHFGILDTCGFPKDVYYYYKANWSGTPIIHIMPYWTWPGSEGKPITVVVFSNAASVELFLNGVSLGQKACPLYGHAAWTVNYQPGSLIANGFDATGRLIATDKASTAGSAYKIVLRTDLPSVSANGEDESVVEASVVDQNGQLVPTAVDKITFTVSGEAGKVVGSGNGDPNDHTPDGSSIRNAFNGRAIAIIRSTGEHGSAVVTAQADGLMPSSIAVDFK